MSRMVAFSVSEKDKQDIDYYAKAKHFGDASHLARVALFAYMERNKVGGHKARSDAGAPARPANSIPNTVET